MFCLQACLKQLELTFWQGNTLFFTRRNKRNTKTVNTPSRPHERRRSLSTSDRDTFNDNCGPLITATARGTRQIGAVTRQRATVMVLLVVGEVARNTSGTPRREQGSTPSCTRSRSPSASKGDRHHCGRSGHRAEICSVKGDKDPNVRPPHWKSREDCPGSRDKRSTQRERTGSTGRRSGSPDKRRSDLRHPSSRRTKNN